MNWYHAHVYFKPEASAIAEAKDFWETLSSPDYNLDFVGAFHGRTVGPHPIPQFEVHFTEDKLWALLPKLYQDRGLLSVLVHPVTPNDHDDHFQSAIWLGSPVDLDGTQLDPPGQNKAFARLSQSSFVSE